MDFERWVKNKAVAVVTGASSGIGAAIAKQLVQNGLTVVGIARRVEKVEELSKALSGEKGKLIPLKCDVSNESEINKSFKWIKENVGPIHILINNAGFGGFNKTGGIFDGTYEDWTKKFNINVLGLATATREAFKQMQENNINGHIVNINSLAGHHVYQMPGAATYTASKYAVTALTESTRHELLQNKSKTKITSVSPGYVATEMTICNPEITKEKKEQLEKIQMLNAEDVASAVFYALSTPEHVQVTEITIRPNEDPF